MMEQTPSAFCKPFISSIFFFEKNFFETVARLDLSEDASLAVNLALPPGK